MFIAFVVINLENAYSMAKVAISRTVAAILS